MSNNRTFVDLSVKNSNNPTNLEKVTKFLFGTFGDADGWDEALLDIKQTANRNSDYLIDKLDAIEKLLLESGYDGFFADLVAWEANWVLDDPSDEGAKEWLQKVADTIREILGDKTPPKPEQN